MNAFVGSFILLKNYLLYITLKEMIKFKHLIRKLKVFLLKIWIRYNKDWNEQLPYALWIYRTSIRTNTEENPFSMVYGDDAVVPLELEIPSLIISLHGDILDEEVRKARL